MSRPADLPPETLRRRRERIFDALEDRAMVLPAAPVTRSSRDTEHRYRPDSELHYVTGAAAPGTVAVLRGHAGERRFVLFAPGRDPEAELWTGPRPGPEAAGERAGADAAFPLDELEERLPGLLAGSDAVLYRMGRGDRVERLVLAALETARRRGPRKGDGPRGVMDPGVVLDEMRLRKEPEEVERIRRAAEITVEAHREAMERVRPGVGEWEVEAWLEGAFRSRGADGPAYGTIVAGGANACVLHYVDNAHRLEAGTTVLVDAGAAWGLYAADITRTYPVDGSFSPLSRRVQAVVDEARARAVEAVAPGVPVSAVHEAAVEVLVRGLVELGVLEGPVEDRIDADDHTPFFPHQTSHWLGLDVHDPGDYAREGSPRLLEPGMVLTVEPGLYFPAVGGADAGDGDEARARVPEGLLGSGCRLEDDVLVTDEGHEVLTPGLPSHPDEVEALRG